MKTQGILVPWAEPSDHRHGSGANTKLCRDLGAQATPTPREGGRPHLPGLLHGLLRVALHLVAGVVGDLGHWLLEDGRCLPDREGRVQVGLALRRYASWRCSPEAPPEALGGSLQQIFLVSRDPHPWALGRPCSPHGPCLLTAHSGSQRGPGCTTWPHPAQPPVSIPSEPSPGRHGAKVPQMCVDQRQMDTAPLGAFGSPAGAGHSVLAGKVQDMPEQPCGGPLPGMEWPWSVIFCFYAASKFPPMTKYDFNTRTNERGANSAPPAKRTSVGSPWAGAPWPGWRSRSGPAAGSC